MADVIPLASVGNLQVELLAGDRYNDLVRAIHGGLVLRRKSSTVGRPKVRVTLQPARNRNVVDVGKKMFVVLEALTKNPKNPPTLEEVTQLVGFAKTTVYRFLNTLQEIGYVEQLSESGGYVLSRKFFELGRPAVAHQYLLPVARPWLEQLSLRTGGTVSLGILDQGSLLYLAVIESKDPYRFAMKPGDYYYAHATAMGKCLLAYLSEEEIDHVIRAHGLPKLTGNTITTGAELMNELAKIKKDGFAMNFEENQEGVMCVGAPIQSAEGPPLAALSISAPIVRMQGAIESMKNEALRVARQLSLMLGYYQNTVPEPATLAAITLSGTTPVPAEIRSET